MHRVCSTEDDNNRSRHKSGCHGEKEGARQTEMKRYAQTGRMRYVQSPAVIWDGLATCLAALWVSEISLSFIDPRAVCLVKDG